MISQSFALQAAAQAAVPIQLLDAVFWLSAAACVVAQYFIVRAVWRVIPSVTGSPDVPMPRRAQEMMWVLLPALLLIGAFVGAWRHLHPAASSETNPSTSREVLEAPASRA